MIPAALLPQRDYLRFWWARVASTCASQMLMVAVGWQMYDLTGSAWDLGLVGLLQFLPALALVLVTGDVVDRHHRARVAAACVGAQAAVALVLALAPWAGGPQRGLLLALSVVLGTAKAFQMPAQQALTPLLVPPPLLPRALAFSAAGMQLAIIAGPAIGGLLYVAGVTTVYATCVALFAVATLLLLRVHHADPPARERATWQTLLAGVSYVRGNPVVLGAISLDLFAVLLGGATALLPMFAKDLLHVGPWGLGLLRGAPAVGALAMSLALTRWPITRSAGPQACCGRWWCTAAPRPCSASRPRSRCRCWRWPSPALPTWSASSCASPSCNWRRPTRCAAASARSTRYSSARRTSSVNSSRAPRRHCSGRWARWCSAASVRW